MCGIAGYSLAPGARFPGPPMTVWAGALRHRGPEAQGACEDQGIGLLHTRLSIIDVAGGHQPLTADGDRYVLVANGEIYNHVELRAELEALGYAFATGSDCETILHGYRAWGDGVLERLNGMFAFALWDAVQRRLLLARDRLGIKPLFLRRFEGGFAFASEMKALRAVGGRPSVDARALAEYFAHQFSGERRTLWTDTERLLPAEAVELRDGAITRRWRYWDARDVAPMDIDLDTALETFDGLFEQVLREHLRSDVPIGLFLSGGVDSSILCARLSQLHSEPLSAYGVGFTEAGLVDELATAERTAGRFGVGLTPIRPTMDDLLGALPESIWAADELMRDFANLPTLMLARGAAGHHKVVFSGEGGDEAFAGYRRYYPKPLEGWLKRMRHPATGGFRGRETVAAKAKRVLYGADLLAASRDSRHPFEAAWQSAPAGWSDLQRRQYVDLVTALPDNLLVKADRMLMAHGVEGRVPFLDHRVVEFGLSLPDHLKVRDRQGKWFLKRWASRYIDNETLFAPKRGFYVPFRQQFRGERLARLARMLPEHPAVRAHFRPEGVRALLTADGRRGCIGQTGFAIFQFAMWYQMFVLGEGVRPGAGVDGLDYLAEAA